VSGLGRWGAQALGLRLRLQTLWRIMSPPAAAALPQAAAYIAAPPAASTHLHLPHPLVHCSTPTSPPTPQGYSYYQLLTFCVMNAAHSFTAPPPRAPPHFPHKGYSDYQLHTFCVMNAAQLGAYTLTPDALLTSGKLIELDRLLAELQTRGSR
jgi:hypothetical protein